MNAKDIFEKLIDRAFSWSLFQSRRPTKPGELIERLLPEEREELQNLTSKDTKEVDHRLMYLHDPSKPTVTVHKLFPSKKDDDES
jgi:hypothetical protein